MAKDIWLKVARKAMSLLFTSQKLYSMLPEYSLINVFQSQAFMLFPDQRYEKIFSGRSRNRARPSGKMFYLF